MKTHRLLPVLMIGFLTVFATAQIKTPPAEEPGIHRELLVNEKTVQVARVTYDAGVVEPAGVHPYDVVVVPLNRGVIKLNIPGQADPKWEAGTAIFIKRSTKHRLANVGKTPIEFIGIRIP